MALGTLSSIGKNLIDFSVANSLGAPLNTRSAACRCPFQSARRTVSFCALNRGLQFWDMLQQAGCIHVVLFPKKNEGGHFTAPSPRCYMSFWILWQSYQIIHNCKLVCQGKKQWSVFFSACKSELRIAAFAAHTCPIALHNLQESKSRLILVPLLYQDYHRIPFICF